MIKKNKIMIIVLVLVMGIGLIYYHNQKKVLTIGIFAEVIGMFLRSIIMK
ncbi:MAG: hypothetical protein ACLRQF_08675 [Thomasclavelia ramosa]